MSDRERRLASALRENLKRRKAQRRERDACGADPSQAVVPERRPGEPNEAQAASGSDPAKESQ